MSSGRTFSTAATWCLLFWPSMTRAVVVGVRRHPAHASTSGSGWRWHTPHWTSQVWATTVTLTGPSTASTGPHCTQGLLLGPPVCRTLTSPSATATIPQTTAQTTLVSSSTTTSSVPVTTLDPVSTTTLPAPSTLTSDDSSQSTPPSPVESLIIATAFTSTAISSLFPMSSNSSPAPTAGAGGGSPDTTDNRTLVITLSTVLSVVGFLLIAGGICVCCRYRHRGRRAFFPRGISPIDDDEIETWKISRSAPEKDEEARPVSPARSGWPGAASAGHTKQSFSSDSGRKRAPPNVIVYQNGYSPDSRDSEEQLSPKSHASMSPSHPKLGRPSLEDVILQLPPQAQARAPNSRVGLTDESVPGDPSFLPSPKRQPSRLSKLPPTSTPRSTHARTRSSRSSTSMRSFVYTGSEVELQVSPRESNDFHPSSPHGRSRIYSSSSIPPRLSVGDDGTIIGGLSPRPVFRDDIGRAIG